MSSGLIRCFILSSSVRRMVLLVVASLTDRQVLLKIDHSCKLDCNCAVTGISKTRLAR